MKLRSNTQASDNADQAGGKPQAPDTPVTGDQVQAESQEPALTLPPAAEKPDKAGDPAASKPNRFKRLLARKKLIIPLALLAVIGLLLAVPMTRYRILGTFLERSYAVRVVDEKTGKPISKALVEIGSRKAETDNQGNVALKSKVGQKNVKVTKKYYRTAETSALVALTQKSGPNKIPLKATGRQVPIMVVNSLTGKPLANALVRAEDTEVRTGKDGKAVIVLPARLTKSLCDIHIDTYITTSCAITVTEEEVKENTLAVTPSGKVFFLSKLSGKIDVVKTNLDGTERETVLAGTGSEEAHDTVLLASLDWKYLALKSKRDGGEYSKLFLIDTSNGELTTMDEGEARFTPVGWSGHRFVYTVNRNVPEIWAPKAQALKSFDASSDRVAVIDETEAEGNAGWSYARNSFSQVSILDDGEIVYSKNWGGNYPYFMYPELQTTITGRPVNLISVKGDGSSKKILKTFPVPSGTSDYAIYPVLYAPGELYVQVPGVHGSKTTYYEYEDGKLTIANEITDEIFHRGYPTYLDSPSGKKTFWSDQRDGKTMLFVGNEAGKDEKNVASLSEFAQYGWYTDDYLLLSKNRSELYVMPVAGGTPAKIADYHRADFFISGYGKGYGGY